MYNRDMVKAIVTKTGNSYALRVPMSYIKENNLKLGDTVEVPELLERSQLALQKFLAGAKDRGPIVGIDDPVQWQRDIRAEWSDPWEEVERERKSRAA